MVSLYWPATRINISVWWDHSDCLSQQQWRRRHSSKMSDMVAEPGQNRNAETCDFTCGNQPSEHHRI